MDPQVRERLLAAMFARRLVALCGAGLSMAPPSLLPSAMTVAMLCYDKYTASSGAACDPALREDLERLADYFFLNGTLKSVFIDALVPWPRFARPSNPGHAALADFLITGAASAALSTNFDNLIERRAWDYGADFRPSLNGEDANVIASVHSPLLKIHGCEICDRGTTVWTRRQLQDPTVAQRMLSNRIWLEANLRQKDLLVLGFWSDWSYLNEVLGDVLAAVTPTSVTVVDLCPSGDLEAKAPALWALAHAQNVVFTHVQESAASVLDELRRELSRAFMRKLLLSGKTAIEAQTATASNPAWLEPPNFSSEELYSLRRDAEGVPATSPARLREPKEGDLLGLFHLLLLRAGAVPTPVGYVLGGRSIRVVNGANTLLSTVHTNFADEPPTISAPDIVACVGAIDLPYPGNFVRTGQPGSIIRPAAAGEWLDFHTARATLNI